MQITFSYYLRIIITFFWVWYFVNAQYRNDITNDVSDVVEYLETHGRLPQGPRAAMRKVLTTKARALARTRLQVVGVPPKAVPRGMVT